MAQVHRVFVFTLLLVCADDVQRRWGASDNPDALFKKARDEAVAMLSLFATFKLRSAFGLRIFAFAVLPIICAVFSELRFLSNCCRTCCGWTCSAFLQPGSSFVLLLCSPDGKLESKDSEEDLYASLFALVVDAVIFSAVFDMNFARCLFVLCQLSDRFLFVFFDVSLMCFHLRVCVQADHRG